MRILGISAFYHDSAAAVVEDGEIIAAAQEERFSRKKHDSRFPRHAIDYCLEAARATPQDIDFVAFYDKPFVKFERLLETYVAFAPRGFQSFKMALPLWLREKLFQKSLLLKEMKAYSADVDWAKRLLFAEHHFSHAASAFYPSPFKDAIVLTMDGVGEWATTSVAFGNDNQLTMQRELRFPHSLGLLYSAFTYYTGFKVNSGEYKLMGLAPYGEPKYADVILDRSHRPQAGRHLPARSVVFRLLHRIANDQRQVRRTFRRPGAQAGRIADATPYGYRRLDTGGHRGDRPQTDPRARPGDRRTQSLSRRRRGAELRRQRKTAARRQLSTRSGFSLRPATPAARSARRLPPTIDHKKNPRSVNGGGDAMRGSYLGPSFSQAEIERRLLAVGAKFETMAEGDLIEATARDLADERAVGWFQGRMEFGPRALGGRSILGDPRSDTMQKTLNLKIKYRESFRPFAPSVLREDVADWFELDGDSPYMLLVADVAEKHRLAMTAEQQALFGIDRLNVPRSAIPAVTHVDYSARIQTVHRRRTRAITRCLRRSNA